MYFNSGNLSFPTTIAAYLRLSSVVFFHSFHSFMFAVLLEYYDSEGWNQDSWEFDSLDEAEDFICELNDLGHTPALIAA